MSDKSYCVVQSTRDIEIGEELTLDYGMFNNLELFTRFGFISENNPHDSLKIELDEDRLAEFSSILFDLKKQILRSGDN